eukprot:6182407-Pleurochrysis_carterae.AAC.1
MDTRPRVLAGCARRRGRARAVRRAALRLLGLPDGLARFQARGARRPAVGAAAPWDGMAVPLRQT